MRFTDNGIGISPNQIDNIFKMFHRATEKSDGAGLGLYIVKEVVEKLNGSIDVTSSLGQGTKFYIKLPQLKSGNISETTEQKGGNE
jgi:signal transduction histidine kinase